MFMNSHPFREAAMVHDQGVSLTRVPSRDGTEIGYFSSGSGSPLLLVHGSLGDHTRWDALRPHLEPRFTVHAMDRRGRGASGDSPDYQIEREYEDVAAVIDSVAESSGSPVDVYCSSYGGLCTFGAASMTSNIRRLALYEAWPAVDPQQLAVPSSLLERVDELLMKGDRETALMVAYREALGLSVEEFESIRAQPSWPARLAAAHTIPREGRAFGQVAFDPAQARKITVPTLLLIGSESPIWGRQANEVMAALPNASIAVLEGQGHVADLIAPELVAEALIPFLLE
jgi:pimeloyl-ACP methyl ester carboxylesterase